MRAPRLLIAGVATLAVGLAGIFVVTPQLAPPGFPNGWGSGFGAMLGPGSVGGIMGMDGMAGMSGMMGGPIAAEARPIGIDRASAAAQGYVASFGDPNLAVTEVMEFVGNYYARVIEQDTGIHAFELLIDRSNGAVFPEVGPNVMWNTKYGLTMMGRGGSLMGAPRTGPAQVADVPIAPDQAQALARQFLASEGGRIDVGEPARFYGYYTLHTLRAGEIEGMLSVNGYSGQVWYHTWHGPFSREFKPSS